MMTSILLLTSVLVGQVADTSSWALAPQLVTGAELIYQGRYLEESLTPGVNHQREYALKTNLFVLETYRDRWEMAAMTVLTLNGESSKGTPSSLKLVLMDADKRGRLTGKDGISLSVPIAGPPLVECGALIELPGRIVRNQDTWEGEDKGRSPILWHIIGLENCNGVACLRIQGQQQSPDWNTPRADSTAWRRRDTVWLDPNLGVANRVERVIEQRDPARRDPTERSTLRYDLEGRLRYPGKLFTDRQREILNAHRFYKDAAPLWSNPVVYRNQLEALQRRLGFYIESQPPTPYRDATEYVKRQTQLALDGKLLAQPQPKEVQAIPTARSGQRMPDFLVPNLTGTESGRLYRHLGKPIFLFFYNPTGDSSIHVLRFALSLHEQYADNIGIVGLAMSDDATFVQKQHQVWKMPFPVFDGRGLRRSFNVEATPRLVVLDSNAVVRAAYTGWGDDFPDEIVKELKNWLPRSD